MMDLNAGDPIIFDAVYEQDFKAPPTPPVYKRLRCVTPMDALFKDQTPITVEGAEVSAAAINFCGQEIYVPLDSISKRSES